MHNLLQKLSGTLLVSVLLTFLLMMGVQSAAATVHVPGSLEFEHKVTPSPGPALDVPAQITPTTQITATEEVTPLDKQTGVIGSLVLGAEGTTLGDTVDYALALTGFGNQIRMDSDYAVIGGGAFNLITGTSAYASIIGGQGNVIDSASGWSLIGSGISNTIAVSSTFGVIGGGYGNVITGVNEWAAIVGGIQNIITTGSDGSTIGGGQSNQILDNSILNVINGGNRNKIGLDSDVSTIGGGFNNAILGTSHFSIISGGASNVITDTAQYATIPGGRFNLAHGNYSMAAGNRAQALHDGSFVWGDNVTTTVSSAADNQFVVRANGGIWLGRAITNVTTLITGSVFISTSTGASLSDGGAWTNASDRNRKENFASVDPQTVLMGVVDLPIQRWNYKAEDPAVRHLGPSAQEFAATFGLGANDTTISTVDADGVSLAAIQGLYQIVQEQQQMIQAQQAMLNAQQTQLEAMAIQVQALETRSANLQDACVVEVTQ